MVVVKPNNYFITYLNLDTVFVKEGQIVTFKTVIGGANLKKIELMVLTLGMILLNLRNL